MSIETFGGTSDKVVARDVLTPEQIKELVKPPALKLTAYDGAAHVKKRLLHLGSLVLVLAVLLSPLTAQMVFEPLWGSLLGSISMGDHFGPFVWAVLGNVITLLILLGLGLFMFGAPTQMLSNATDPERFKQAEQAYKDNYLSYVKGKIAEYDDDGDGVTREELNRILESVPESTSKYDALQYSKESWNWIEVLPLAVVILLTSVVKLQIFVVSLLPISVLLLLLVAVFCAQAWFVTVAVASIQHVRAQISSSVEAPTADLHPYAYWLCLIGTVGALLLLYVPAVTPPPVFASRAEVAKLYQAEVVAKCEKLRDEGVMSPNQEKLCMRLSSSPELFQEAVQREILRGDHNEGKPIYSRIRPEVDTNNFSRYYRINLYGDDVVLPNVTYRIRADK